MLLLDHISTGYGKRQVLFDISFAVRHAEIVLLVGSNGSGKSTVLKTIYGLLSPWPARPQKDVEEGKIVFDGRSIVGEPPSTLLGMGLLYVPQKNNCFENLTGRENLEISGLLLRKQAVSFAARLDEVLEKLPMLKQSLARTAGGLSGGERQVLALGMAVLHRPRLIMMDEPFAGLSPKSSERIRTHIEELNKSSGVAFVIVEHAIKQAISMTDRLISLRLGKIVYSANPKTGLDKKVLKEVLM